jgi:hypothetical protein
MDKFAQISALDAVPLRVEGDTVWARFGHRETKAASLDEGIARERLQSAIAAIHSKDRRFRPTAVGADPSLRRGDSESTPEN